MCVPYDKTFPPEFCILNMWPWPLPLAYFWKTLTLAITFLSFEIKLSYLACVIFSDSTVKFDMWPWMWHLTFFRKTLTLPPRTYAMPCGALPDFVSILVLGTNFVLYLCILFSGKELCPLFVHIVLRERTLSFICAYCSQGTNFVLYLCILFSGNKLCPLFVHIVLRERTLSFICAYCSQGTTLSFICAYCSQEGTNFVLSAYCSQGTNFVLYLCTFITSVQKYFKTRCVVPGRCKVC